MFVLNTNKVEKNILSPCFLIFCPAIYKQGRISLNHQLFDWARDMKTTFGLALTILASSGKFSSVIIGNISYASYTSLKHFRTFHILSKNDLGKDGIPCKSPISLLFVLWISLKWAFATRKYIMEKFFFVISIPGSFVFLSSDFFSTKKTKLLLYNFNTLIRIIQFFSF